MIFDGLIFDLSGTLMGEGGEFPSEGIPEGLSALSQKVPLFIASNCDVGTIEAFLKTKGLADYFTDTICSGDTGKSKDYNLEILIEKHNLKKPVMIGDADADRRAAKSNKIPFLFVTYGYGIPMDLDQTFASFEELKDFLLKV